VIVEKISFAFRLLTFVILAPLILIGILDITAYVIARTLRAPKDRQRPALIVTPETTTSSSSGERTASISSIHGRTPAHGEPLWFTFPAADEKLSGVGIFSPPISRAPTPSSEMPNTASSLFITQAERRSSPSHRSPLEAVKAEETNDDQEGYEGDVSIMSEDAPEPQATGTSI